MKKVFVCFLDYLEAALRGWDKFPTKPCVAGDFLGFDILKKLLIFDFEITVRIRIFDYFDRRSQYQSDLVTAETSATARDRASGTMLSFPFRCSMVILYSWSSKPNDSDENQFSTWFA